MLKMRDWALCALMTAQLGTMGSAVAQQGGAQKPAGGAPGSTSQAAGAPAPPAHPATEEQVREYLTLTGIVTGSRKSMESNVDSMQATAAPFIPADFWSDLKSSLQKMDLLAIYTPVLQRYLSQENMAAMLTFYRSPAGKVFLSVQPRIADEAETALRGKGSQVGQTVFARHKDEIEAAKKKYLADHPAAAGAAK